MAEKRLNNKQLQFCKEYIIDLNATQAAIRAGYSKKTARQRAHNMFTLVYIQDEIQRLFDKRSKRTEINADWVITNLTEVTERCMQSRPVVYANGDPKMTTTKDGEIAPTYAFDSGGANRALELIGRHLAMFTDNLNIGDKQSPYAIFQHKLEEEAKRLNATMNKN